jgi:hypothetical protein
MLGKSCSLLGNFMINHHCSKLLVGDDVCCYCNTRSAGYRSRIAQYTLDLINSCRYDVVSIVVAIKTYEELMQFFTRTCHEEFEKGGFEIGIPWTKLAFEEPFQLLDLSVMYICFYSIYHGIKHGT